MDRIYQLLHLLAKQYPIENAAQAPRIVSTHKNVITLWVFADATWHEFSLPRTDWVKEPQVLFDEITKLMKAKSA